MMGCVSASGPGLSPRPTGRVKPADRPAGRRLGVDAGRGAGLCSAERSIHERSAETHVQRSSIDVIASALEPVLPDLGRLSSPDGALTLMLCDVEGAEEVAERLGPDRWAELLRDHHTLVRQVVGPHEGELASGGGDGFMAYFNSAH